MEKFLLEDIANYLDCSVDEIVAELESQGGSCEELAELAKNGNRDEILEYLKERGLV